MKQEPYEYTGTIRPRRRGLWLLAAVIVFAVAVLGVVAFRENNGYRSSHSATLPEEARHEGTRTGTGGRTTPVATDSYVTKESPAVIKEIETITGSLDGHELIGSTVHLHVPVLDKANDQAFWVGSKDNRVLVVPNRDHRDNAERQLGLIADNGIAPLAAGEQAEISGTIQKVPSTEEMFSWNLTADDKRDVAERGIYLRADRIRVE